MEVKMYGRNTGCKFCDRAKLICKMNNFKLEFVDVEIENLGMAELANITGKKDVRTVPQIFVDKKYIGGCTEFEKYLKGE